MDVFNRPYKGRQNSVTDMGSAEVVYVSSMYIHTHIYGMHIYAYVYIGIYEFEIITNIRDCDYKERVKTICL